MIIINKKYPDLKKILFMTKTSYYYLLLMSEKITQNNRNNKINSSKILDIY